MSLINDALKRAKQAQQKNPPPTSPGPALRPIEPARRKETNFGVLLPLALVALVVVGGLIVWLVMPSGGEKKVSAHLASSNPTSALPRAQVKLKQANLQNIIPNIAIQTSTLAATVALPVASAPPIGAPVQTAAQPIAQTGSPVLAGAVLPTPDSAPSPAPTATAPTAPFTQLAVVASVPPPPALPKLQGIFYRPERPTALLNGKTVLTGGMVGDYRVVAISQQSVTVVRAGQTNVLEMPD